jgi:hypothetical protein
MKVNITCPVLISKFKKHDQLKEIILKSLEKEQFKNLNREHDKVFKTDWVYDQHQLFDVNSNKEYVKIIAKDLVDHLTESYLSININSFEIHNIWFQQYIKNDFHEWHAHSRNHYTNIYYLELPDQKYSTEFINPITNEVFQYDVKEGDLLSIPAFIFHRSPVIDTSVRKTIISFNTCFLNMNFAPVVQWRGQESSKL